MSDRAAAHAMLPPVDTWGAPEAASEIGVFHMCSSATAGGSRCRGVRRREASLRAGLAAACNPPCTPCITAGCGCKHATAGCMQQHVHAHVRRHATTLTVGHNAAACQVCARLGGHTCMDSTAAHVNPCSTCTHEHATAQRSMCTLHMHCLLGPKLNLNLTNQGTPLHPGCCSLVAPAPMLLSC